MTDTTDVLATLERLHKVEKDAWTTYSELGGSDLWRAWKDAEADYADALYHAAPALLEVAKAAKIAKIALDLDFENSPPQWSRQEAGQMIDAALKEATNG